MVTVRFLDSGTTLTCALSTGCNVILILQFSGVPPVPEFGVDARFPHRGPRTRGRPCGSGWAHDDRRGNTRPTFLRHGIGSFLGRARKADLRQSLRDWKVTRTFKAGSAPEHMVFSLDERRIYVVDVRSGRVSAVDVRRGCVGVLRVS